MFMRTGMGLPLSFLSSQRRLQQPRLVNNPGLKRTEVAQYPIRYSGRVSPIIRLRTTLKITFFYSAKKLENLSLFVTPALIQPATCNLQN
jgi:hypothetical protein